MSDNIKQKEHDAMLLKQWLNSDHYKNALDQRVNILRACEKDKNARAIAIQTCRDDPVFFINNFGWTFDPRRAPFHFPFIMFPFQEDAVRWIVNKIRNGGDGLIEKSRDMGATWIFVWVLYYFYLLDNAFNGLLGSYKEKLVDDRTNDSLFGKLDYCLQNTPKWMMPKRFKIKEHRNKLKLVNPEHFNLLTGDTMNPDFSRGARKNVVFMDEGAAWDYFREAWESAGDSTPCRLTVSTPQGRNAFALLRETDIDRLTLHWKLHPLKDMKWYEFQKLRRTDEEVAQELDISYQRSQVGRVYPEWNDVIYGTLPYNPDLLLYVSWDFGKTDQTAIIWWQKDDKGVYIVDSYSNTGKNIDFYVPFITGVMPSDDYKYNKKDLTLIEEHKNWKKGTHFGDPAGRFRNQVTNKTVISVLNDYGIKINFLEDAKGHEIRKTETKILLRNLRVNENERTKELGAAMENARYPEIRRGGGKEINSTKPRHDWTSHYRSSVEYFAVNYHRMAGRSSSRVRDKFPVKETGNSPFPKRRNKITKY